MLNLLLISILKSFSLFFDKFSFYLLSAPNLKDLWFHLRKRSGEEKLREFEDFLGKLAQNFNKSKDENSMLKNYLKE
jgi:hypothetical protein